MPTDNESLPFSSRILIRLLDRTKKIDYLIAFVFAACPIPLAWLLDLAISDTDQFIGYWQSYNVTSHALLLPLALFLFRWAMSRMAPVGRPWPVDSIPAIVKLVESAEDRRIVYTKLRRALLGAGNVWVAFLISIILNLIDMRRLIAIYAGWMDVPDTFYWRNWGVAFAIIPDSVGKWENLAIVLLTEASQFCLMLISVLLTVLIARHNIFFLQRVYQRHRVTPDRESSYFHIDLDDVDKCFGFRSASRAFNTQVLMLAMSGLMTLFSRIYHVYIGALWEIGQIILAVLWLIAFFVCVLPSLIKLLPWERIWREDDVNLMIKDYLYEFLSDRYWPFRAEPDSHEIGHLAARFAENSFWPTGDNRAGILFFFSFFVFLVILFPDPTELLMRLLPIDDGFILYNGYLFSLGITAYLLKLLLFGVLRQCLRYIDERLVDAGDSGLSQPHRKNPTQQQKTLHAGVFISYRRADSAGYAGRLHDNLVRHLENDKIFMDVIDIDAGTDFVNRISETLKLSSAMIVLIGKDWLTNEDAGGERRLDDPEDFVHFEIATALARGVRIFPVLVNGARMPAAHELPAPLANLARINAIELSDMRWEYDVGRLLESLSSVVGTRVDEI